MENEKDLARFKFLSFDDYKAMSKDVNLSKYQKIGFPDSYRERTEKFIFRDIVRKLTLGIGKKGSTLLDIGPGCSDVPIMIIDFCKMNNYHVLLADSQEMLDHLPNGPNISKYPGYFPEDCLTLINKYRDKIDYIICYSVLHGVFYHTCIYKFIDSALSLLRTGGKLLIGDLPNISKKTRFFSTETGVKFHQNFTKSDTLPNVEHLNLEASQIDDGIIMGIVQRYRNQGFETYLLPQPKNLSMSNRREDILICKI